MIGVLAPVPAEKIPHQIAAFWRGLAEAGYVEGKNLAVEYRFADITLRPELMPEVAGDLLRLTMKVIFAAAPEAVAAVRNATTSIPIVALDLESDPLAQGYVKSLARPGGDMTGVFLDILLSSPLVFVSSKLIGELAMPFAHLPMKRRSHSGSALVT